MTFTNLVPIPVLADYQNNSYCRYPTPVQEQNTVISNISILLFAEIFKASKVQNGPLSSSFSMRGRAREREVGGGLVYCWY